MKCEQIESLLSGFVDDELTQGDRQRVEIHLEDCEKCRKQESQLSDLRRTVGRMPLAELTRKEWDKIMNDLPVRTSRGLGWLLYGGGLVVLSAYAAFSFWTDDTVPALTRVAVAALVIGLLCLFYSVTRQRLIERKTDK